MNVKEIKLDLSKRIVMSLRETASEHGIDYETVVSDWMYSIESDYQNYYGLHEDDWDYIKITGETK